MKNLFILWQHSHSPLWGAIPEGGDNMVAEKGLGYFGFDVCKLDWDDDENQIKTKYATRTFTGKSDLQNGNAVIMDGPFTKGADGQPTVGANKWVKE